ncbi:MAG: phage DNA encapsidation protein [Methanobrevibacter sp.]|nr:phage DNA encapsidation protein [Methanobrevibacter sp.]
MKQLDNIHYSFRAIDGHDKPYNFVVCAREPGKSTMFMLTKHYFKWKQDHAPLLYIVRNIVEITEALILSIQDVIINKFTDDNITLKYSKASMREGLVDVYIQDVLFMRIEALSITTRKIKQSVLPKCRCILFDEFIINPKNAEKYLSNEAFKFKELYTTNERDRLDQTKPLKAYFLGNPYSLFNPYFVMLSISPAKLKFGQMYVGDNYVVDYYKMLPELRDLILKQNPFYQFDEEYRAYALEGKAILDKNIKLGKLPQNYHLRFVFKFEEKYIGIFQNNYWQDHADIYFCTFMTSKEISKRRIAYCFDFKDLMNGTELFSREDKNRFSKFKIAMKKRLVAFQSIDCYYLIEEIYYNL